jgi:pyrroloquinoline quinone (PQQ) biosynthesis protein C
MGTSFSGSLPLFVEVVTRTDEARRRFETHPVVVDAVAQGVSRERYQRLLLELYHVVWHFNPICAAAASRIGDDEREVRYFLYEHMQEESGHERWVLNDLQAVGVAPELTHQHVPSGDTLALNGYNYWAAERRHPCSALGMLYTLEVISSVYGGPFAAAIKESLFLDGEQGISFIGSHATLDSEHMAELREVINKVQTPAAREAVVESALLNFQQFTRIVEAI